MSILKNPLILALDVDHIQDVQKIMEETGDLVGGVKIGPRLVNRYGASLITELSKLAPVFIDNKYFDIPSTMLAAVKANFEAGATLVTVHALAGSKALSQLSELETELNRIRPFKILAVTILTSWGVDQIPANFQNWSIENHVCSLAELVQSCGLTGLVCSGHELAFLNNPGIYKVTPGIQLDNQPIHSNDQHRTMTPAQAIQAGASALVVGRAILQSLSPRDTILNILESLF